MPVLFARLSPVDILIIAGIALLFFGGKKIGDLGKGLGDGIRAFKENIKEQPPEPTAAPKAPEKIEGKTEA